MRKYIKTYLFLIGVIVLAAACSTEKNTFINRSYHGLNAHYNGYFNATELLRMSMATYKSSRTENYYELLPIDPMPNKEEVIGMYPAIDTAIAKCKKVITDHSMPSNDRPSKKKEEHNRWIDENWTTIGIASYYRRDYEGAMKSFEFVRKFYSNDPSLYVGELWMAKTHIAQGKLTKAKFNLDNLDKAIQAEVERNSAKEKKSKKSKFAKKDDEVEIAKFPKDIRFELELTKAELALLKDEKNSAIEYLETSLKHAQMKDDVERVHFILGQLYAEKGDAAQAEEHYTKVIRGDAPYQMSFNARIQRAFLGNGEKVEKELRKMLRDAKNSEFKDQIYYALAELELKNDNKAKGKEYLTLSAFYSIDNTRQKGMAYERLADMSFAERDYIRAQKYYDSCGTVIEDTYPNAEGIRNKAIKLSDLVVNVERVEYEDSVQRIAAMDEASRVKFIEDVIKKIKKDEEERKRREAERLRELQENQNVFVQGGDGGKWYWNNAKTREEGYQEFKRLWGVRENEDHWRRSEKIDVISDVVIEEGEVDSLITEPTDTLTVENLLKYIPLSDSALARSNERLLEAEYNASVIYKEELNEVGTATEGFESVIARKVENKHNLLAAYQLYQIYEKKDPTSAAKYKSYIMDNYPTSDFANYLRDPDYFIKKKERDALAEQEYTTVLDRYNRGLYYPVLTKANQVIENEKDNQFRSKYLLLKALAQGQLNEDKSTLVPTLNQVIEEYPETLEATKAQEMLDIIANGYSENIEADFGSKSPFTYDDKAEVRVLVFLPEGESSNSAKGRVADFNRDYFSRDRLTVNSKIYTMNQSVIVISGLDDESAAEEYVRVYKSTRKYLLDLQNANIKIITLDNMKILFKDHNLEQYELFYEEYY